MTVVSRLQNHVHLSAHQRHTDSLRHVLLIYNRALILRLATEPWTIDSAMPMDVTGCLALSDLLYHGDAIRRDEAGGIHSKRGKLGSRHGRWAAPHSRGVLFVFILLNSNGALMRQ